MNSEQLRTLIVEKQNLSKAIDALKQLIDQQQNLPYRGTFGGGLLRRVEEVEANYLLMRDFMQRGFDDPERDNLYRQELKKLYGVYVDFAVEKAINKNTELRDARARLAGKTLQVAKIREMMEAHVQDVAFQASDNELLKNADPSPRNAQRSTITHATEMGLAVDAVLTSHAWDIATMEQMTALLCAPTVETTDTALLVSAIMLANSICFDVRKWLTLLQTYQQATNETVRQRALVGWLFTMPDGEEHLFQEIENTLKASENDNKTTRELLELQMQMAYCLNADADTETIRRDIMPTLMRNSDIRIIGKEIEEMEEDPLQDILNPGAADEAIEEMEKAVGQMADMQKKGVDIYFGGFSQMKRFPFFYKLCNWLTPFYEDHPELHNVKSKLGTSKFLQLLFQHGPFCDSDKYSFALALTNIVNRIPANIREMLDNEEAFGEVASNAETQSPAYVRRMYLQDLFRFYRLYQGKDDFPNPFETTRSKGQSSPMLLLLHPLLKSIGIARQYEEYEKFLYKRGRFEEIIAINDPSQSTPSLVYATTLLQMHRNEEAEQIFASLINKEPDNLPARKGYARAAYRLGHYHEAVEAYQHLNEKTPEDPSLQLSYAMALIADERAEDAIGILYKIHFEHPDDVRAMRVLAWAHLADGNTQKADDLYARILSSGNVTADDY
ncbi:MAG: tetratricopeptide repeat protein, partial [Prevotella sp.]|nr:tetratricopeptide repeat protein [Prevotella sp.]